VAFHLLRERFGMNFVALRMLTGDRAKYLGLVFAIMHSSLLSIRRVLVLEPAAVFR